MLLPSAKSTISISPSESSSSSPWTFALILVLVLLLERLGFGTGGDGGTIGTSSASSSFSSGVVELATSTVVEDAAAGIRVSLVGPFDELRLKVFLSHLSIQYALVCS